MLIVYEEGLLEGKMPDTLAPVKGIVREKNANVDVNIIRRDRAILYRIQPRKAAIIRSEAIQWRRPVTKVDELINVVLHLHDSEISEPSKKVLFSSSILC